MLGVGLQAASDVEARLQQEGVESNHVEQVRRGRGRAHVYGAQGVRVRMCACAPHTRGMGPVEQTLAESCYSRPGVCALEQFSVAKAACPV